MPILRESKARVRTRTGCFECRKRRKKCDEQRPSCQRCANVGSACTWPTITSQPMDGRMRENRQWKPRSPSLKIENEALYTHFATAVMPRLVRPNCPSVYSDQSHMFQLSQQFPPLMEIMIAIAALDIGNDELAIQHYLHSLRGLQGRIIGASDTGNDDGLLATTICLCVFENLRTDSPPNIGLHAKAAGVLLSQRHPEKATQSPYQPGVIFQRTCVESFLYHSTLMMLLNISLDVTPDHIPQYLACAPSDEQAAPGPVLDESYQFFFMIANVTRLARLSRDLDQAERQIWTRLQSDIQQYERTNDIDDPMKRLYSCAVRILLLKGDTTKNSTHRTSAIQALFDEGLSILKMVDLQKYLLGYSLWPVTVLGAAAVSKLEQDIINSKIEPWARLRRGQAVRVQERLMNIWALPRKNNDLLLLHQLQLLMEPS
ncbi:unnamed protein product [Penicillium salamii]|nr:unnamed protein product [Penicillium salamii]